MAAHGVISTISGAGRQSRKEKGRLEGTLFLEM
jgi:hypothetical protein